MKTILDVSALLALLCFSSSALAQAPTGIPTINRSVTISVGSTFQTVITSTTPPSGALRSLTIQNNNTNSDNCWIFLGPTASATKATSILLGPGGSYQRYSPYVPSDNIAATCATTSDTLYVDTQ